MQRVIRLALAFAALTPAVTVTAQSIVRVGPTRTFTDIHLAIQSTNPGDIVLVDPGTYGYFLAMWEVEVRADPPGTTFTTGGFAMQADSIVDGAVVDGTYLMVAGNPVLPPTVHLRNCTLTSGLAVIDANVNLTNCTIRSGIAPFSETTAATVARSRLTATQTSFVGIGNSFVAPYAVFAEQGSVLQFDGCTLTGGERTGAQPAARDGLHLQTGAVAWLADCVVRGGGQGGAAPGAAISGGGALVDRCTLQGASSALPGTLPGIAPLSALVRGATTTFDLQTQPGALLGLGIAIGIHGPVSVPFAAQPLWHTPTRWILYGTAIAAANGHAPFNVPIPNVAALQHLPVQFCAIGPGATQLQLSPPVLGLID